MQRALIWFLLSFFGATSLAFAAEPKGIAVIAADGATDAAWPLARGVYTSNFIRPAIDDAHARVLAGEPAPEGSPELAELAELRAGIKGDDAASREVLASLAQKLSVRGVVVVFATTPPSARLFDATSRAFDAARYAADVDATWASTVASLERPYRPATPLVVINTQPSPIAKKGESKAFYESPWFWAAIGAAALIGGGVLIATNVQSGDNIHLQMRLP